MLNVISATAILALLGLISGALLAFSSTIAKRDANPLIAEIDSILPQSQCGQCGYPGCIPYAKAVAAGTTAVNLCKPGGRRVTLELAKLLQIEPPAIDPNEPSTQPLKMVALIEEENCVGCTKCLQVCPVDAIIGAPKALHTVITDLCTGCELCVAPCPTDCIAMVPLATLAATLLAEKRQAGEAEA